MTQDPVFQEKRILFVDDDEDIRTSMQRLLARRFAQTFLAENGQQALEIYRQEKPDLIVTDMHMPVISGIEMIKEIRKSDQKIPIVVMSAFSDNESIENAYAIGASDYVNKPINRDSFFEILKKNLLSS